MPFDDAQYRSVADLFTRRNLDLFADLLVRPSDSFLRIDERVEYINSTTLRRDIRIWVSLVGSSSEHQDDRECEAGPIVIPALSFRRDRLVNDVTICDQHGSPLELLNRTQTMLFTEMALRGRILASLSDWTNEDLDVDGHYWRSTAVQTVLDSLSQIPYQSSKIAAKIYSNAFEHDIRDALRVDRPAELMVRLADERHIRDEIAETLRRLRQDEALRDFCYRLTTHEYMLIVVKGDEKRSTVRVVYDSVNIQHERDGSLTAAYRRLLAHLPHAYRVHIPLASKSQSYHFRMDGPQGHFVWEQSIRTHPAGRTQPDSAAGTGLKLAVLEPLPLPAIQLGRPTRPNNECHLYLGKVPSSAAQRLFARAVFFEKPPGMLGVAAAVSGALAVILGVFLSNLTSFVEGNATSIDSAALLVLAPGLAAAVLLPSMSHRRMLQGPLRARAGMMLTVFVSIAAAVLLALMDAMVGSDSDHAPAWFYLVWIYMCLSMLIVSALCTRSLFHIRQCFHAAQQSYLGDDIYTDIHHAELLGREGL